MSTMSATVHGFGVSDAYIVKYGRKYLCAKWLAFTLHDRVFALAVQERAHTVAGVKQKFPCEVHHSADVQYKVGLPLPGEDRCQNGVRRGCEREVRLRTFLKEHHGSNFS